MAEVQFTGKVKRIYPYRFETRIRLDSTGERDFILKNDDYHKH